MAHAATSGTWYIIKQLLLVSLAAICFSIFMILWFLKPNAEHSKQKVVEVEQEVVRSVQMETIANTENIGAFMNEVPELNLTQRVVVSGEHDPEFRGNKFITTNKSKFTIQVMSVSEEKVVLSYLAKREDRNKFNYLRTQDGKNSERYVVIYGTYKDQATASAELQKMNFTLPESVKPVVKKIGDYEKFVNDLGSEEKGVSTALRNVVLSRVRQPQIAAPAVGNHLPVPPVPPKTSNTISTRSLATTGPLPYNPPAPKPVQQPSVSRKVYDISPKSDDTPVRQVPKTTSTPAPNRSTSEGVVKNNEKNQDVAPKTNLQPKSTEAPTRSNSNHSNSATVATPSTPAPTPRRNTEQVVDPF